MDISAKEKTKANQLKAWKNLEQSAPGDAGKTVFLFQFQRGCPGGSAISMQHGFSEVRRKGSHIVMQKNYLKGQLLFQSLPIMKSELVRSSPLLDSLGFPAQNLNHKIKAQNKMLNQPRNKHGWFSFLGCTLDG
jgi:hypothetical protein